MLDANTLELLLLIGGVEPNPGPPAIALHRAAWNGDVSRLRRLLEARTFCCFGSTCDIEAVCAKSRGRRALHYAAGWGSGDDNCSHLDCVLALLQAGADPNAQDFDGLTALHYAVLEERVAAISALLRNGAALEIRDNEGDTPLELALSVGHERAAHLLIEASARETPPGAIRCSSTVHALSVVTARDHASDIQCPLDAIAVVAAARRSVPLATAPPLPRTFSSRTPSSSLPPDDSTCVICYERPRCVLFLPCKHVLVCQECSLPLNVCPFDQQRVSN